ncbi:MAG: hypothetical protein FWE25_11275, partial [Lachnospiraceae bacterium]|nr:hypothetical protein [Lachnospiraceae bacterium]
MGTNKERLMQRKRHRHFWKRMFGLLLVLLMLVGGTQAIASNNASESQGEETTPQSAVDFVQAYEYKEEAEVGVESPYIPIVPAIESAPITTAADFRAAILNPDYTVINIGASFSVAFTTTGATAI